MSSRPLMSFNSFWGVETDFRIGSFGVQSAHFRGTALWNSGGTVFRSNPPLLTQIEVPNSPWRLWRLLSFCLASHNSSKELESQYLSWASTPSRIGTSCPACWFRLNVWQTPILVWVVLSSTCFRCSCRRLENFYSLRSTQFRIMFWNSKDLGLERRLTSDELQLLVQYWLVKFIYHSSTFAQLEVPIFSSCLEICIYWDVQVSRPLMSFNSFRANGPSCFEYWQSTQR